MTRLSISIGVALLTAAAGMANSAEHGTNEDRPLDYHLILSGSGGEESYQQQFKEWSTGLRTVLTTRLNVPAERVRLLRESLPDDKPETSISAESIAAAFGDYQEILDANDRLYVFMIGHGSFLRNTSKFHIPGPDITAEDMDAHFNDLDAGRIIVLNSTSSSAGFINVLSGPDRVICTATKSVDEVNATEFMEHFLAGLRDGSADRNHDERISFLEACRQAADLTAAWYTGEGLLATEHAILDDDGDGLGTRLREMDDLNARDDAEDVDGALADTCYLKDFDFGPNVPQEMIDRYLSTLDRVDELKARKDAMETEAYYEELQSVLVEAAKINREMRQLSGTADRDS